MNVASSANIHARVLLVSIRGVSETDVEVLEELADALRQAGTEGGVWGLVAGGHFFLGEAGWVSSRGFQKLGLLDLKRKELVQVFLEFFGRREKTMCTGLLDIMLETYR